MPQKNAYHQWDRKTGAKYITERPDSACSFAALTIISTACQLI
ncbi:MAG TPA: hypothetical protein VMV49_08585 [Candidatus Deferrimicrobium sp.]|nr:hypothetical protein [Candidatus Deferrimicrobium sp.]